MISNKCVTDYKNQDEPGHKEVVETGQSRQAVITELVRRMVRFIGDKQ